MDFLVGTFNTTTVYTLRFQPPSTLSILHRSSAIGSHSWLALSHDKRFLYATAWLAKPAVVAYRVLPSGQVKLLNSKETRGTSGYVACSKSHLYSAGGVSGEAFELNADGSIGDFVQELAFVEATGETGNAGKDSHGDFGGLRHGAHSVDLSPDGKSLYIADIGRNCIWTYSVTQEADSSPHLTLGSKHISPRSHDGPRHTIPHPNGNVLYSLQEHSSMIDAFSVAKDGTTLTHTSEASILPEDKHCTNFWADEVRVSNAELPPKFIYGSTRGLEDATKGYVSAIPIDQTGNISGKAVDIFETETSGGIANAVEPAPPGTSSNGLEYMALTDSLEGFVFVLAFDGRKMREVARVKLDDPSDKTVKAATAVWL